MFCTFICRKLLTYAVEVPFSTKLYYLQINPSLSFVRCISTIPNQDHSFSVNYLITTLGFSPKSALSASKYVKFKTPLKPDSVIAFFKDHNFTDPQISNIIKRNPLLILANPQRTLFPKLNFLYSIGLSNSELAKILYVAPNLLMRSLKSQIIPSFNFCKSLIQDNEKIIKVIKNYPKIFVCDVEKFAAPNMEILKEFGVPGAHILDWFVQMPRNFLLTSGFFRQIVEQVESMGFNPINKRFILAAYVLASMSKLTWKKKIETYKKWNLSEKEIIEAFVKSPWCMAVSEKKIISMMDYFVNTMGIKASVILKRPVHLTFSLEKRIIPRYSVVQVLLSKRLIKLDFSLSEMLQAPEKLFLKRFVACHEEEASYLLKLYNEKLEVTARL